ncbi:MAG: hypothetical protein NTZ78_04460 [Candidatus Aureabacteria bacterium]|nr:hypothetical protein [Candidatus Auribacterota bacterium]
MKLFAAVVLGLNLTAGMAVAGSIDSSGPPSSGSGMYSLSQIYDYLNSGTEATPIAGFQGPGLAPGSTMRTTKQIYDDLKAKYDLCPAAAVDVKSGVRFFSTVPGSWGIRTGTAQLIPTPTPTVTATPTATPLAGGEWALVPANPTIGTTTDFYVMKYEAKCSGAADGNCGNPGSYIPISQTANKPWHTISQTSAIDRCQALGTGYHLCTVKEVQTINRNIEAQTANWANGSIGSTVAAGGGLKRGNVGLTDSASYDGPDPDYEGAGTGSDRSSTSKAKLVLSNGQEIWDWSGNIGEYIYGEGTGGTIGTTGYVTWETGAWYEWSTSSLNEERPILGPSNSDWGTAQGMGEYYGGVSSNAFIRGGPSGYGAFAGCFGLYLNRGPSAADTSLGFRCCK